jgi:hypothetical protein
MSALTFLSVDTCPDTSRFLDGLTQTVREHIPSLSMLQIMYVPPDQSWDFERACTALLRAFGGLRALYIQCEDCGKIDVAAILNHGSTLRVLLVVTGTVHRRNPDMCFSAADITRLASVCPRIQQLCLNIFDLAPGASEDLAGSHIKAFPDVVVPQTHFEAALGAIAKMPSLQTLRLPDSRIFRIGTDQGGDMAPGIDLWVAQGNQQLRFRT